MSSVTYVTQAIYNFHEILLAVDLEGYVAVQHLISHDPHSPEIHLLIVTLAFQNLRTDIQRRPTKRRSERGGMMDCPSEIADSRQSAFEEYVLGFDIAVDDF